MCTIWGRSRGAEMTMRFRPGVATVIFSLGLTIPFAQGPPIPASDPPITQDSDGRYQINSCPIVYVENESFFLCDVSGLVIAFTLRGSEFNRQREYFISVWNTGVDTFDFHPQNAVMTVTTYRRKHNQNRDDWESMPGPPRTVSALPFSSFEHKLKKKERVAAILMSLASSMASLTESSTVTATTTTARGKRGKTTTIKDPARAAAMRDMRAQELRNALSQLANETEIGLQGYAKSNTLAHGMMTAGGILFPKVKPDEFRGPFELDIDIGSHRFTYVGG